MKTYISVVLPQGSTLPSSIFFEHRKLDIEQYLSGEFVDGVSVHHVKIAGKEKVIYHEEIPKVGRWYVMKKTA